MSQPAITVRRLTKRYGRTVAVDDLEFEVRSGTVTGFLGPNGAGKTTTMRVLLGLAPADAGQAFVLGQPYRALHRPARRIGTLLDGAGFHPSRTARNHLRALAAASGIGQHRVEDMLDVVELTAAADRKVGGFSLGMRRRLGLASALLGDPELLLLDEPANGLDPAGIRWLRRSLQSFAASGGTVFLSSHLLAEVAETADEVVVVHRGSLVTHTSIRDLTGGRTVSVRTSDRDLLRKALAAKGARLEPTGPDGLVVGGLTQEEVGTVAAGEGVIVYELTGRAERLEDVFLGLVQEGDHRVAS
ncbi:MAG TPA: ATP-binding cassette domain-containing protein [Acidimicrobiales bacterium]|nr:ATP-binding cassette domain-containing protein [Acidimicrobiales bacterium]